VADSKVERPPAVPPEAPEFVQNFTARIIAGEGISCRSARSRWTDVPDRNGCVGKAEHRARNPSWNPDICIQCGKCSISCPHAAIRIKAYDEKLLADAPAALNR